MGSFEYLLAALTPLNLLLALAGVVAGTVIGALPGLTATMAVAVLVPFTFAMEPASALIALGAIYTGAIYGGAYAAILLNTPGTPSSIATTFDGYPMAHAGRGDLALTLACLSSVVGGLVGAGFLLLLAPPMATVALKFGPVEYFWLAIFGLTLIASLGEGSMVKGLIGGCIGLLLSMVGVAEVGGDMRYVGDSKALLGGIDVVSALIGLYCVPVLIELVATPVAHLRGDQQGGGFPAARGAVDPARAQVQPGAQFGASAPWSASCPARAARSRRWSRIRRPSARRRGATTSARASPTASSPPSRPTTPPSAAASSRRWCSAFRARRPTRSSWARCWCRASAPGPRCSRSRRPIVYTFIWGLILATLIMLPVGLLIGRFAFRSIVAIPKAVLVPAVALLTVLGSFAVHNNLHEVQQMVVLGVLAWVLARFGFTASPIVLGLILGSIAERGFVQGHLIGGARGNVMGEFFGRPISLAIIVFIALGLLWPWWAARRARIEGPAMREGSTDLRGALGSAAAMALGAAAIWAARDFSELGAVFPRTVGALLVALGAAVHRADAGRPHAARGRARRLERCAAPRLR